MPKSATFDVAMDDVARLVKVNQRNEHFSNYNSDVIFVQWARFELCRARIAGQSETLGAPRGTNQIPDGARPGIVHDHP